MAPLTATRGHPVLTAFAHRVLARGQAQTVAMPAAMRQCLTLLHAMVHTRTPVARQRQPWSATGTLPMRPLGRGPAGVAGAVCTVPPGEPGPSPVSRLAGLVKPPGGHGPQGLTKGAPMVHCPECLT